MSLVRERFGRLDVLVNNAGIKPESVGAEHQNLIDTPADVWRRMHAVNVFGTFVCCREAARIMTARGSGSIVNISSGLGKNPHVGRSAYCSSKSAVNMLTQVLALELHEHRVAVNAVNPGYTATEETVLSELSDTDRRRVLRTDTSVPLVLFLAKQPPGEVTGQIIDAVAWNAANGFGGPEVWAFSSSVAAQAKMQGM
jgi:3-oxoacyl-[acyl-carrier protein] reductase